MPEPAAVAPGCPLETSLPPGLIINEPLEHARECPSAAAPLVLPTRSASAGRALATAVSAAASLEGLRRRRAQALQQQPRGRSSPLVPEFKNATLLRLSLPEDIHTWDALRGERKTFTLARPMKLRDRTVPCGFKVSERTRSDVGVFLLVGEFFSISEFVEQALSIDCHPFDSLGTVPDEDLRTIFEILSVHPDMLADMRAAELARWERLAAELEAREGDLHCRMAPGPREVLKDKNLLLLKFLLLEIGWPDKELVADVARRVEWPSSAPYLALMAYSNHA